MNAQGTNTDSERLDAELDAEIDDMFGEDDGQDDEPDGQMPLFAETMPTQSPQTPPAQTAPPQAAPAGLSPPRGPGADGRWAFPIFANAETGAVPTLDGPFRTLDDDGTPLLEVYATTEANPNGGEYCGLIRPTDTPADIMAALGPGRYQVRLLRADGRFAGKMTLFLGRGSRRQGLITAPQAGQRPGSPLVGGNAGGNVEAQKAALRAQLAALEGGAPTASPLGRLGGLVQQAEELKRGVVTLKTTHAELGNVLATLAPAPAAQDDDDAGDKPDDAWDYVDGILGRALEGGMKVHERIEQVKMAGKMFAGSGT